MKQNNYTVVRTADGRMTTYRVMGIETADNAAICQALTEAARDVWEYLTTTPGTYTAAELAGGKLVLQLREGAELPAELTNVSVECGTFKCSIGLVGPYVATGYYTLFERLSCFESYARKKQAERAIPYGLSIAAAWQSLTVK